MQFIRLFKFKKSFTKISKIVHFSNFRVGSQVEKTRSSADLNYFTNLSMDESIMNVEPLFNFESIELSPYEHYFKSIDSSLKTNINLSEFQTFSYDELIDYSRSLLLGFSILKAKRNLPPLIKKSSDLIEMKIGKFFPNEDLKYDPKMVTEELIVNSEKTSFKFLNSCLNKTERDTSFIDVCIQSGDFENAFKHMTKLRIINKTEACLDQSSIIMSSKFYEPAINILSYKGKLHYIGNLLNEMDETNLLPTLNIIVRSLEACGKKNEGHTKDFVLKLLSYLKLHNVTMRNAFIEAYISKDSYQYIIKALNSVDYDTSEFVNILNLEDSNNHNNSSKLENTSINLSLEQLPLKFDSQLDVETKLRSIEHAYKNKTVSNKKFSELNHQTKVWKKQLSLKFREILDEIKLNEDVDHLKPYLMVLDEQYYTNIMLRMLFSLAINTEFEYISLNALKYNLANEIYKAYKYKCLKRQRYFKRLKTVFSSYFKRIQKEPDNTDFVDMWNRSIMESINEGNLTHCVQPWNNMVLYDLGDLFYRIMSSCLNYSYVLKNTHYEVPVFVENLSESSELLNVNMSIHERVKELISVVSCNLLAVKPEELPMLHPPVPINNSFTTGFLFSQNYSTRLVRETDSYMFNEDLQHIYDNKDIFNSITALSNNAWKVDEPNLELITELFVSTGCSKLKIPPNPNTMKGPIKPPGYQSDKNVRLQYRQSLLEFHKYRKEMYSLWASLLYKLNIANKYKGMNIWYPYSMDFRSRIYPCPPHLIHIGNDVTRGLMKFALSKPLGPKGMDWMKIHLINLYGSHKRQSNTDRLNAANEQIDDIYDSAMKPFDGRGWWKESDKPWQTLLICREILQAYNYADKHNQGDPSTFHSHVSIHQDGSCNGLQHYAALARDSDGARAVNLTDTPTPQDVYSDVLYYVNQQLEKDASNGINEAQLLQGLVHRKIIKQTVMTIVYGVTNYGATLQIHKQLKAAYDFDNDQLNKLSSYLSRVTMDSVGQLFKSASQIQNWLTACASEIGRQHNANIQWKTPLNMLIIQPYYKPDKLFTANLSRNRNAFPPNFIHSLDSTHMMMTTLRCWRENVTFVSVHDCYWTHACDVDKMNKICREEFIKLYSQPILQNLSDYLYNKFSFDENSKLNNSQKKLNKLLRSIPEEGQFDIKEVLKSTYFFS